MNLQSLRECCQLGEHLGMGIEKSISKLRGTGRQSPAVPHPKSPASILRENRCLEATKASEHPRACKKPRLGIEKGLQPYEEGRESQNGFTPVQDKKLY